MMLLGGESSEKKLVMSDGRMNVCLSLFIYNLLYVAENFGEWIYKDVGFFIETLHFSFIQNGI
jgi:hypothetical protein